MNKERADMINEFARRDNFTNDTAYNKGLRAIRNEGYENVFTQSEVKYYVMCNFL